MSLPHLAVTVIKRSAEVTTTTGNGDVIWDPDDGKIFVVQAITLNVTAAATISIFDGVDGNGSGTLPLRLFKGDLNAKDTVQLFFENGWTSTAKNNILRGKVSTGTLYVEVVGYEK